MTLRVIPVIDCAPLRRGQLVVFELDAPSPLLNLSIGAKLDVLFRDGSRETVELKSLGFASSTPDHAHIIVTMTTHDPTTAEKVEIQPELS